MSDMTMKAVLANLRPENLEWVRQSYSKVPSVSQEEFVVTLLDNLIDNQRKLEQSYEPREPKAPVPADQRYRMTERKMGTKEETPNPVEALDDSIPF